MLRKISLFQFAILLSILFCSSVGAQDNPESKKPWKRFSLKLGAALGSTDTSVRLDTQGLGLNLNLEDLLGVEQSASTIRLEGFWRFAPRRRHRLDFTWFSFSRTGFNSINQAIDIGDITIPANANIRTELDVDVYRVGYSCSFFQDDRFDLAVATGLYVIPLRFQLDAEGLSDVFVSESITAPLPLIGLRVDVAITPKWFLRSSYDWFYLEFGDFRGAVFDTQIGMEYFAFKNVGFGLGVQNLQILIEAESDVWPGVNFTGKFDQNGIQAMAYLRFYFGK